MKQVVIDASVIIKWMFPERPGEGGAERALDLLGAIGRGDLGIIQPPHWLAEAAAVATRLDPVIAREAIPLLYAMELPVADGLETYQRAVSLAAEIDHHLFDTLYHAVALVHPDTVLVTADERYLRKARSLGRVIGLDALTVEAR